MTIARNKCGCWSVTCNECGDQVELNTDPDDPIMVAVNEVKGMGWRIARLEESGTRNEWLHYCKDCR
jgi:hypothetical protein